MKIKIIFILNLFLTTFLINTALASVVSKVQEMNEEAIAAQCNQEKNVRCEGSGGVDGVAAECYYEFSTDKPVPDPIRDREKCFATHRVSIFKPCGNTYVLKSSEKFKVSCKEFYRAVQLKNKECNNCLKVSGFYGA